MTSPSSLPAHPFGLPARLGRWFADCSRLACVLAAVVLCPLVPTSAAAAAAIAPPAADFDAPLETEAVLKANSARGHAALLTSGITSAAESPRLAYQQNRAAPVTLVVRCGQPKSLGAISTVQFRVTNSSRRGTLIYGRISAEVQSPSASGLVWLPSVLGPRKSFSSTVTIPTRLTRGSTVRIRFIAEGWEYGNFFEQKLYYTDWTTVRVR